MKVQVWREGGVITVGKDSKTGNKGTHMMFVRYGERKSDSVHMWDPLTMRVVVMRDTIWLNDCIFSLAM